MKRLNVFLNAPTYAVKLVILHDAYLRAELFYKLLNSWLTAKIVRKVKPNK